MSAADDAVENTLKNLKKIRASKGKLQGNYYYAGSNDGRTAGLVVTLSIRDKKGMMAFATGKPIRKEISGAKFSRFECMTPGFSTRGRSLC